MGALTLQNIIDLQPGMHLTLTGAPRHGARAALWGRSEKPINQLPGHRASAAPLSAAKQKMP